MIRSERASRAAVVLDHALAPALAGGFPDPARLRLAMLEDGYDLLAGLDLVESGIAVRPGSERDVVVELTWPGDLVVNLPDDVPAGAPLVVDALTQLAGRGFDQGLVVCGDAPDLPGLLVGKLWRALGRAVVAVCPADGGGLVALAARLPLPGWAVDAAIDLDDPRTLERLAAGAPRRTDVALGPGWHRVRTPDDLAALDPGLEGWAATRAVLLGPTG